MPNSYPWPLSEISREDADNILKMSPGFRHKRIEKLKAEILARAREQERLRRMPFLQGDQ